MSGRHHIPFRFVCNRGICTRAFKNRSGLTQHIHRAHPPRSPPQSRPEPEPEVPSPPTSPAAPFIYPEVRNPDAYAFLNEEEDDWRAFNPYADHANGEDEVRDGGNKTDESKRSHFKTHPILDGKISSYCYIFGINNLVI